MRKKVTNSRRIFWFEQNRKKHRASVEKFPL